MLHLRHTSPRRLVAALTLLVGFSSLHQALPQSPEYDVANLGTVPASYLTYGHGLNDHGEVVGTALFIPGGLKAWTWTASQGFALLPQPPIISDYGAVDINNAGVIAGDGGGDGGEIWRYTGGTYEMLGVLPGTPIPKTAAINAAGSITGACYGTLFYNPRHSFLAAAGSPMVSVLDNSEAYGINDAGQITGSIGNVAYRITPSVGVELLPPLGSRDITAGYSINNAGNVVGVAGSTVEHSSVPFLFSDADGMQEVGNFGGRAHASDVNDLDEVVGNYEPSGGVRRPWVWSWHQGVRFLNDVIDPALNLRVRYARGINNAGQILCDARDQSSNVVTLLLTPIVYCQPDLGFGGPGAATLSVCGKSLFTGNTADLRLHSSVAGAIAFVGWGPSFNPTPFGAGTIVPTPPAHVLAFVTDSSGDLFVPGILGGGGPFELYIQAVVVDPIQPGGLQFTNAVGMHFFP